MTWIDNISWSPLLIVGVFLAIAPINPEPHLAEKLQMLSEGMLIRPADIFDLLMHSTPSVLMAIKAIRQFVLKV